MFRIEIRGPKTTLCEKEQWATVDSFPTVSKVAAMDCYRRWLDDCGDNHDVQIRLQIWSAIEHHHRTQK